MNAYDSARYYDLLERQGRDETLSAAELARLNRLDATARKEWENEPRPQWLGGDYPDL